MSRAARWTRVLLPLVAAAGCGEAIELQAGVGLSERNCQRSPGDDPWLIRSIRVEVIEWQGGAPGGVLGSECLDDLDAAVRQPMDLLGWFEERGYVAQGIPTDLPTRVHIVGFGSAGCRIALEGAPEICAISQDTLSETGFDEGDTTSFSFTCRPAGGLPTAAFTTCLRVGSLPRD